MQEKMKQINTSIYLFRKKHDLAYLCVASFDVSLIVLQFHLIAALINFFLVMLGYDFIEQKIGVTLLRLGQALGAEICIPQI